MKDKEIDYKGKVIIKNSTLSLVYKGFSMVLSLVSAPLLLDILGNYKYGIFASALSIVSWIYYFDLGIGNGLRFRLTECIANDDDVAARKTISISYVLVSIIMSVVLGLFCIILSLFDVGNLLDIKSSDENLNIILLISLSIACVNFVISLVNNVLLATQESSKVNFFSLIGQLFYIIGLFLYKKYHISFILMVAIAEGISQFFKNVIETLYVYKKYPLLKPRIDSVDFAYSKGILSFGLKMFIVQIAALILNSTDNLIILKYCGGEAVTPYSFVYKYFGMINTFFMILINPIMSAYTMAYTKKDFFWIKKTLKKSLTLYLIVVIFTIIAALLFRPFARIWLHRELQYDTSLIVLTSIYFILLMFSHNFSTFVNGIGVVNETTIAVGVQAIMNIPLSIFFATNCKMGVNGVILGSIACMCLVNIVYPYVTYREMKKMK
ncbi:lipopolysaccharide biosynthesis protein [Agathobacter sp.]